jgi:hypothetical protein
LYTGEKMNTPNLDKVLKPYFIADQVANSHLSQCAGDEIYANAKKELEALKLEIVETQERCTSWCEVASDMLFALRNDYAPGQLGELDGVKAIRKLQRENKKLKNPPCENGDWIW